MNTMAAGNRSRNGKSRQGGAEARGARICGSCGETNQDTARFCQACGRQLAGGGWLNAQTVTVLAAACLSLLALGLLFASVIDTATRDDSEVAVAPSRTASSGAGQPPDLSTMSPREAADRLFNRVMMADEQGNREEVAQFAPMAVAAYDQVQTRDLDALYHTGLIHAAVGDSDEARDVIERLRAVVPDHLLASLLEHRLAVDAGDQDSAQRAIERFEASYDTEIKVDRPEYRDHQRQIDRFRSEVSAADPPTE